MPVCLFGIDLSNSMKNGEIFILFGLRDTNQW